MFQDKIKSLFSSSIQAVVSRISDFAVHPEKDFTHREKFPADILLAFLIFSRPKFSPAEYFVEPGHSAKGSYSIHINAFYDLDRHTYTDAIFQPVHQKDEFRAFCEVVDRHPVSDGTKNVYFGDRGYCSYNNMAHVIENQQYFLFRTKDIHSKGLVRGFDFPEEESFDIDVDVALVRSHSPQD